MCGSLLYCALGLWRFAEVTHYVVKNKTGEFSEAPKVKQEMRPTSQPNCGPDHTGMSGPLPMESPAHLPSYLQLPLQFRRRHVLQRASQRRVDRSPPRTPAIEPWDSSRRLQTLPECCGYATSSPRPKQIRMRQPAREIVNRPLRSRPGATAVRMEV